VRGNCPSPVQLSSTDATDDDPGAGAAADADDSVAIASRPDTRRVRFGPESANVVFDADDVDRTMPFVDMDAAQGEWEKEEEEYKLHVVGAAPAGLLHECRLPYAPVITPRLTQSGHRHGTAQMRDRWAMKERDLPPGELCPEHAAYDAAQKKLTEDAKAREEKREVSRKRLAAARSVPRHARGQPSLPSCSRRTTPHSLDRRPARRRVPVVLTHVVRAAGYPQGYKASNYSRVGSGR